MVCINWRSRVQRHCDANEAHQRGRVHEEHVLRRVASVPVSIMHSASRRSRTPAPGPRTGSTTASRTRRSTEPTRRSSTGRCAASRACTACRTEVSATVHCLCVHVEPSKRASRFCRPQTIKLFTTRPQTSTSSGFPTQPPNKKHRLIHLQRLTAFISLPLSQLISQKATTSLRLMLHDGASTAATDCAGPADATSGV